MTATNEQQIFADQNVLVSTTRLIVTGVTYPLSNVSSVRLLRQKPNYTLPLVLILVGVFLLAAGKYAIVWALISLIIGVAWCFALKSEYVMLIGSAGGEKAALRSTNAAYMTHVVEQINNAIVLRG